MRYTIFFIAILGIWSTQTKAQLLNTEADTTFLLEQTPFPKSEASVTLTFRESMLRLKERPDNTPLPNLEAILEKLEKDSNDVASYGQLFDIYREKSEMKLATFYLTKALEKAIAQYESDKTDVEYARQLTTVLMEAGRYDGVVQVWQEFVENNPGNAEGWASFASFLLQFQELDAARQCMMAAYELEPLREDLYIAEIIHQFYLLIKRIGEAMEDESIKEPDFWDVDNSFVEKAMEDHPNADAPKMADYAVKTVIILFETILDASDNLSEIGNRKQFKLKYSKEAKKQAKIVRAYMDELLKRGGNNLTYPHRCLAVLDVLEGNLTGAEKHIRQMEDYSGPDREMYKLLFMGYMPGADWDNAIKYLNKAQQIGEAPEDYMAIARLYYEMGKYAEALTIFEKHSDKFQYAVAQSDYSSVYALGAIYLRQRRFSNYLSLIQEMEQVIVAARGMPIKDPVTCAWYRAVAYLLQGDKDAAKEMLDFVEDNGEEDMKDIAEKTIKRFFK